MRPLHLALPVRAAVRSFTTHWAPPPRIVSLPSPAIPPSPILRHHAVCPRRPFSRTACRRNEWRDPRRHDPHEHLRQAKPLFTSQGFKRFIRSPSLHTVIVVSMGGAILFYFSNIQTVPVSGRRRFNCYSEAKVNVTAEAQAKRIEWELERAGRRILDDWDWRTRLVRQVMQRLIPVSGMEDSQWEIKVIDDPHTANAFVLPGGKVFVFSGLIPIARNEHGLAAVLGHEIAHNLAEHVGERMSSQLGANILLYSLITLTGGFGILVTSWIGNAMLDLVFSRPMGRRQEAEADYIGLMMMAEACYDPREALGFWERMKRMSEQEPPEWMSTHPSHSNRIQKIQEWMPKALEKLQESDCQGTAGFASLFRQALLGRNYMEKRHDI
ncbi:peptidase family M48-domain-containing protein [Xylaria bambusicola]|uniref:peptidase family M48-domain-containing protein n=1 Tax=Xylaria bambusicola TaxID=326684 RepID=UPI00200725F0|nr:peptidase family M48-domain-containing protein [Xylaria bambusicola]KAI0509450.1 peptidase family M48-domain-containing protein [Xylaria bambusicola]